MPAVALLPAILRTRPPALLAASALGWLMLLLSDTALMLPALCQSISGADGPRTFATIDALVTINPPVALLLAWFAMLLAMMPLLLAQPLSHIWRRSLRRRRVIGVAEFLTGYVAVWTMAGGGLIVVTGLLDPLARALVAPILLPTSLIALAWHLTPLRQRSLNRCHRLARLSAFGLKADRDCFVYGVTHAVWCAGACWALMLVPFAAGGWHLAAMAAIALILIAERLKPARPARWGFAWPSLVRSAMQRPSRRRIPIETDDRQRTAA